MKRIVLIVCALTALALMPDKALAQSGDAIEAALAQAPDTTNIASGTVFAHTELTQVRADTSVAPTHGDIGAEPVQRVYRLRHASQTNSDTSTHAAHAMSTYRQRPTMIALGRTVQQPEQSTKYRTRAQDVTEHLRKPVARTNT